MRKPLPASKMPAQVTLESGPFAWCTCGKTSTLPFCDGTHRGTKFTPVLFKVAEKRNAWICHNKPAKKNSNLEEAQKTL